MRRSHCPVILWKRHAIATKALHSVHANKGIKNGCFHWVPIICWLRQALPRSSFWKKWKQYYAYRTNLKRPKNMYRPSCNRKQCTATGNLQKAHKTRIASPTNMCFLPQAATKLHLIKTLSDARRQHVKTAQWEIEIARYKTCTIRMETKAGWVGTHTVLMSPTSNLEQKRVVGDRKQASAASDCFFCWTFALVEVVWFIETPGRCEAFCARIHLTLKRWCFWYAPFGFVFPRSWQPPSSLPESTQSHHNQSQTDRHGRLLRAQAICKSISLLKVSPTLNHKRIDAKGQVGGQHLVCSIHQQIQNTRGKCIEPMNICKSKRVVDHTKLNNAISSSIQISSNCTCFST